MQVCGLALVFFKSCFPAIAIDAHKLPVNAFGPGPEVMHGAANFPGPLAARMRVQLEGLVRFIWPLDLLGLALDGPKNRLRDFA